LKSWFIYTDLTRLRRNFAVVDPIGIAVDPIPRGLHEKIRLPRPGIAPVAIAPKGHAMNDFMNKEAMDGFMAGTRAAAKRFEAMKEEFDAFSKAQMKEGIAASKALKAAKSMEEAVELQMKFARSYFENSIRQMSKLGALGFDFMQESIKENQKSMAPMQKAMEPLTAKFNAAVEKIHTATEKATKTLAA
jgi:hypothetical protein